MDLASRANTCSSPLFFFLCPTREKTDENYLYTNILLPLEARQSPFWLKDLGILKAKVLLQDLNGMMVTLNAVLSDADLTFYRSVSQGN